MDSEGLESEFRQYAELQQTAELLSGDEVIEIVKALAGVKNTTSILKEAIDLAKTTENADLIRKLSKLDLEMAEVESELAKAKRETTALEDENASLRKQLQEALSPIIKVVRRNGLSYVEGDKETPICAGCHGSSGSIIPLNIAVKVETPGITLPAGEKYKCPSCGAIAYGKE